MTPKQGTLDEQIDQFRKRLIEAGVKVMSGNWGGKGGIAKYKGQWFVVIDRHLPSALKLHLLQAMIERLKLEGSGDGEISTHRFS